MLTFVLIRNEQNGIDPEDFIVDYDQIENIEHLDGTNDVVIKYNSLNDAENGIKNFYNVQLKLEELKNGNSMEDFGFGGFRDPVDYKPEIIDEKQYIELKDTFDISKYIDSDINEHDNVYIIFRNADEKDINMCFKNKYNSKTFGINYNMSIYNNMIAIKFYSLKLAIADLKIALQCEFKTAPLIVSEKNLSKYKHEMNKNTNANFYVPSYRYNLHPNDENNMKEYMSNLPLDIKNSLHLYIKDSNHINKLIADLYTHKSISKISPLILQAFKNIKKAFLEAPALTHECYVYRGIHSKDHIDANKFISTSKNINITRGFYNAYINCCILEITVSKGIKILPLYMLDNDEDEILLESGQKMCVAYQNEYQITGENVTTIISCYYLPSKTIIVESKTDITELSSKLYSRQIVGDVLDNVIDNYMSNPNINIDDEIDKYLKKFGGSEKESRVINENIGVQIKDLDVVMG